MHITPRRRRVNEFPNRAFFAFTVALAASSWSIFSEIWRPYFPSIPIVVYTFYLFANRIDVGRQDSDSLKDSPYFLGFLLTMFGLFKIFNDVSYNFALFSRSPELMTQEVGGAVLTTIVGLFSRQALLGLVRDESPPEDDRLAALANAVTSHAVAFELARQEFFREMADERTKQSKELEATQQQFLARLEDLRTCALLSSTATDIPLGALDAPSVPIGDDDEHRPTMGFRTRSDDGNSTAVAPTLAPVGPTAATPRSTPYVGPARGVPIFGDEP